jgi:hypothetical protein
MALSFVQPITLSLSLLQRMASNNDDKHKMEEAESSMVRKQLRLSNDDDSFDYFDSPERELEEEEEEIEEGEGEGEEEEEEVFSEEMSMNQLDTSEEKLDARRARSILFSDDSDTPSTSAEP